MRWPWSASCRRARCCSGKTNVPHALGRLASLQPHPRHHQQSLGRVARGRVGCRAAQVGLRPRTGAISAPRSVTRRTTAGPTGTSPVGASVRPGVRRYRVSLRARTLLRLGPLARSAKDLELALKEWPAQTISTARWSRFGKADRDPSRRYKVGVLLTAETADVDRTVQDRIQGVVEFLARKGAKVSDHAICTKQIGFSSICCAPLRPRARMTTYSRRICRQPAGWQTGTTATGRGCSRVTPCITATGCIGTRSATACG